MIRRWQLGQLLRQYREAAGVPVRTAAAEIEVTAPTMSKIENGKQAIKPLYIKVLAPLYGLPDDERLRLLELAEDANQPGWWVEYGRAVPDWFKLYLGYETDATSISEYEAELVPGILQTPAYAEVVALASRSDKVGTPDLQKTLGVRRRREERLLGEDPPKFHAVLNEAVLLRAVGGREVMREQLHHIIAISELDHVTVQVLPFTAGAHPAMTSQFTVLGFDDSVGLSTVYLENGRGALYLESEADLSRYGWIFSELVRLAATPSESRDMMARVVAQLI
jgi:transcriptional regulator with XRE-family HTH domain